MPCSASSSPNGSSSGTKPCPHLACNAASTLWKLARCLSSLLTNTSRGMLAATHRSHASSVPTSMPSTALTTRMARSATLSAASSSPTKWAYPGASRRLTLYVSPSPAFQVNGAMPRDNDMPRFTSSGSVPVTVVPSSTRPTRVVTPARCSSASTSVVLPAPLWPTRTTLRIRSVGMTSNGLPPVLDVPRASDFTYRREGRVTACARANEQWRPRPVEGWRSGLARGVVRRGRTQARELTQPFQRGDGAAHRVGRYRVADEVALRLGTPEITEDLQLMHALHALGDHVETERTSHRHDGAYQRPIVGVVGHAVHERPVDLDPLQRELLQQRQRGVTGSEVVERDPHAERTHSPQRCQCQLGLGDHDAFGDLEPEQLRRHARTCQRLVDDRREVGIAQLARRHVDRHGRGLAAHTVVDPASQLRECFEQCPGADGHDRSGVFGDGDELGRRHDRAVTLLPAHQGFEADHIAGFEIEDRLMEETKLAAIERAIQRGLDREPMSDALVHRFVVDGEAVAAGVLGAVHRRVRVAQEVFGR